MCLWGFSFSDVLSRCCLSEVHVRLTGCLLFVFVALFSFQFFVPRSMAEENFSDRNRRGATSLSNDPAWTELESDGFSKVEQLRNELGKAHHVGYLFDSELECLEVVKGLHGPEYTLHEAMADSEVLYKWTVKNLKKFEVDRREDRKAALRYRLPDPKRVAAVDAYEELLGMDVKLKARVSKANYRLQIKFPSSSRTDIENVAREYWLNTLVGYVEEAQLPIVQVARSTSNPGEVMRRAFGNRRMKTLRNRARSWARVREWLLMFCGDVFPRDVSFMLEYLSFLVQEDAPKGRFLDAAAALSVLEDAGQVASDMKISAAVPWVQGFRSRIAELELSKTKVKRAPPLSVSMLVALELSVVSLDAQEYFRAMCWIILLCTWACLRLSDLEGLDPSRLFLGSRGLRGTLVRTKTTGPGKQVKETPIYVSRRISLTGNDWLRCGFDLWEGFGHKNRDYFVMCTDETMSRAVPKYATAEKVALYVRQVFINLEAPDKSRFQPWRLKDDVKMFDRVGILYWTGHSMRHFLPTAAAAIDIGKEQRDYVGRWHVNLHQSADYVHTSRQIVLKVQEAVNRSIVVGKPGYDESELIEDYGCFLVTKGRLPKEWVRHHAVWTRIDGETVLGGKWPTMDSDVIDAEIWAEHAGQDNIVDEPEKTGGEDSGEPQEDMEAPFFVTISRHTGFRRLHKSGCCNTHPWACYKVEYLSRVVDMV